MAYLLGIDAGTTSMKAILFDYEGNIVSSAIEEYALITPEPDFAELKAETYWIACRNAIKRVLKGAKINVEDIISIAVSSQGETLIVLGKDGKPLRNAIVWLDNRSKEECSILKDKVDKSEFYEITGQPQLVPTWPVTKILWIRRNEAKIFEKAFKFLLVEDYLNYKLSGNFITEYSVNSSTGMLDIKNKRWWSYILNEVGITEDQLPALSPSGSPIGNICEEAALETGLSKKTLVGTGAFDHAAAAIGAGNIKPGILTETTGAALAIVATIEKPIYDPEYRIPCHCHAAPGLFFLMPWSQTAGIVLKWYRDNFSIEEKIIEERTGIDAYELLDREAMKIPPGSEGLIILPHLMGAACPEFDPSAKGVIFGITLKHSRAHFAKAIMESVAYMLRRNIEVLESLGIIIKEVRSLGGAAKSLLWTKIKSDVLQKRVIIPKVKEASALGAAILAGVASKVFPSIDAAINSMVSIKDVIEPNYLNKSVYDKSYESYLKLYEYLKPLFLIWR
jgi:xylulokinase